MKAPPLHLLAALFCLTCVLSTAAYAKQTFGLVIGIDEYRFITDLHGAVNDAEDIADALETVGADVTVLLNEQASRDAIIKTWTRIASQLEDGDQFFISYAGHGSYEPEHHKGSEADGRDENFLLSGFSPYGDAAGERIRDDEIAELIALSPQAQIVFVADACHSGTVSRDVTPTLGYRYTSYAEMSADPLPPPPPPSIPAASHNLYLSAVDDSQKTPEFLIDGEPRGALSYAFAAGLRGAADENGDLRLSKGELETYVRRTIRTVSNGLQRPQVEPTGEPDQIVLALAEPKIDAEASLLSHPFDALPKLTLSHTGNAAMSRVLQPLEGVLLQPTDTPTDLTFDTTERVLRSMIGDVIRSVEPTTPAGIRAAIQSAANKERLVTTLKSFPGPHEIHFSDGDGIYHKDEHVGVSVVRRNTQFTTLMNLASDGLLTFLYPRADLGDDPTHPLSQKLAFDLRVTAPFGADHIIALQTPEPAHSLHTRLARLDGTHDINGLWNALRDHANATETTPEITIFPFHSKS